MTSSHERIFDRFTMPAKMVLRSAAIAAVSMNHLILGTEHILNGLVQGCDRAAILLASFGVTHDEVDESILQLFGTGDIPVARSQLDLSNNAKELLAHAISESRR